MELSLILPFGVVDVEGLLFGGVFTLVASSEEETVSEEDDEGTCGFVLVGLLVGCALEEAGVEEGVLGAGFWAAVFLGALSSSLLLLLLLLESEEETFCATGDFLVLLIG